jgi:hypothetical protein
VTSFPTGRGLCSKSELYQRPGKGHCSQRWPRGREAVYVTGAQGPSDRCHLSGTPGRKVMARWGGEGPRVHSQPPPLYNKDQHFGVTPGALHSVSPEVRTLFQMPHFFFL